MMLSAMKTFGGYALLSVAATLAVMANAYHKNGEQYFPAALYLVNSKAGSLVLGNLVAVTAVVFARGVFSLFLGEVRDREAEKLSDTLPMAVIDSLLMMTIFHEAVGARFLAHFGWTLLLQAFHLVLGERVAFLEQTSTAESTLEFARLCTMMWALALADVLGAAHHLYNLYLDGPSVSLLFALSHMLLCVRLAAVVAQFVFSVINLRLGNQWERKGILDLYAQCASAALRFLVHVVFFFAILAYYGMPIHMIRQMLGTFVAFQRSKTKLDEYRAFLALFHERCIDASPEELAEQDICIICRAEEPMMSGKKLPCSHIFHAHCLRDWLQNGRACPLCMHPVLDDMPAAPDAAVRAQPNPPQAPVPANQVPAVVPQDLAQEPAPVWNPPAPHTPPPAVGQEHRAMLPSETAPPSHRSSTTATAAASTAACSSSVTALPSQSISTTSAAAAAAAASPISSSLLLPSASPGASSYERILSAASLSERTADNSGRPVLDPSLLMEIENQLRSLADLMQVARLTLDEHHKASLSMETGSTSEEEVSISSSLLRPALASSTPSLSSSSSSSSTPSSSLSSALSSTSSSSSTSSLSSPTASVSSSSSPASQLSSSGDSPPPRAALDSTAAGTPVSSSSSLGPSPQEKFEAQDQETAESPGALPRKSAVNSNPSTGADQETSSDCEAEETPTERARRLRLLRFSK